VNIFEQGFDFKVRGFMTNGSIPESSLRASAAQVLGLDPAEVERTLAAADSVSRANPQLAGAGAPSATGLACPADGLASADPSPAGFAVCFFAIAPSAP